MSASRFKASSGMSYQRPSILKSSFVLLCLLVIMVACLLLPADKQHQQSWAVVPLPAKYFMHRVRKIHVDSVNPMNNETGITTNHSSYHPNTEPSSVRLQTDSSMSQSLVDVCEPVERLVYIKTHKTGSTTLASILERFGYIRNLSFAMSKVSHIICEKKPFAASMAFQIPKRERNDFDMLVNHARYNRREMDKVVPRAKYISIIRNPLSQLESVFGYFEMGIHLKIRGRNPFRTFMESPKKYYDRKTHMWERSRNGQLYDLGLDHDHDLDEGKVRIKIETLSQEIDLMMINEYFDESLILLKKLMCWNYTDILYLSNGVRSKNHRFSSPESVNDKIIEWSAGDVLLYDHFNRTFWRNVQEYGPSFRADLASFRSLEEQAIKDCVDEGEKNLKDRRVEKIVLKNSTAFCRNLKLGDVEYTKLIRKGMIDRAAAMATKQDQR